MNYPVDVVITWVDSTDENWIKNYEKHTGIKFKKSERFTISNEPDDELSVCLKLINKNMPWIRNKYIVTQRPQIPKCITNEIIIFHDEIGLDNVFNSRAIESCLYKIPNMSEHFIYINDDVYVTQKVRLSQFFDNGKPLVRMEKHKDVNNPWLKSHLLAIKICDLDSNDNYNKNTLKHTIYPLTKSIMKTAHDAFYNEWENSKTCKIRYSCNEIPPIFLSLLLALKNNIAINASNYKDLKIEYFSNINSIKKNNDYDIVCIGNMTGTKEELYKILFQKNTFIQKFILFFIIIVIVIMLIINIIK